MELQRMISTIATRAAPVAELARGQLSEWVEEYKKATRTLETLGFTVGKFTISMGLLPEVHTTLSGKVESLRKDRIEELMQEHHDQPSTVTLLKALLLAKEVSDHLEGRLESVTLNIKLGIPPSVDVELH